MKSSQRLLPAGLLGKGWAVDRRPLPSASSSARSRWVSLAREVLELCLLPPSY